MDILNVEKRCKECGSEFLKQEEYITHVKSHFTTNKVKKTINKKIKLDTIANKTITKKIKLDTNAKKTIAKKIQPATNAFKLTYQCPICGKFYSSLASLKTHKYTYHSKKNELKKTIDQTKETAEVAEVSVDVQSEKLETPTEETEEQLCSVCNESYVKNVFVFFPKCHYQIESLFPKFDNDTKRICLACKLKTSENYTKDESISGEIKNDQIIAVPIIPEPSPPFCPHNDVIENLTLTPEQFYCSFCQSNNCENFDHYEVHNWLPPVQQEVIDHPHDNALEQFTLNPQTANCIFCNTACDRPDHVEINCWVLPEENQSPVRLTNNSNEETFNMHELYNVINNQYK